MSSGMFRGKESSNRIELSQLDQNLLNFAVLGSLQLWGWGGVGGWGWLRSAPPHTCTCIHTHACMVNMIISIANGCPHWGNPWEFPMMSYTRACVCTCMHVCACVYVWGAPSQHPHPPSPIPRGDPRNQSKFNSTWTNQDISILFEDLKSVETSPPMGGCIVCGWVDGWGQVKTLKI